MYLVRLTVPIVIFGFCSKALEVEALPELPVDLKVSSYLTISNENALQRFKINEYIDTQDGSLRLDVFQGVYSSNEFASPNQKRFYRLMSVMNQSMPAINDRVIAYDPSTNLCDEQDTSEWPLKDLTRLLGALLDARFQLGHVSDQIYLGPTGLLRLVYNNPGRFKLIQQSRNEVTLECEYHFWLELSRFYKLADSWRDAKLVASISMDQCEFGFATGGKLKFGTTLLSEVAPIHRHVSSIALLVLPSEKNEHLDKLLLLDLIRELERADSGLVSGLIVDYTLIQGRSLTKHTGLETMDDESQDTFLLPAGVGCGSVKNTRPYTIRATQFSGQFRAANSRDQFYVAYDEASNHLRYDIQGRSKIIYVLDDNLVIYVADSAVGGQLEGTGEQQSTSTMSNFGDHEELAHCAQASLTDERPLEPFKTNIMRNRTGLQDILGLGDRCELMYLGQTRVLASDGAGPLASSDFIPCRVFEREISLEQVPALLLMHLKVKPSASSRLALVYHLVDELSSGQTEPTMQMKVDHKTMWLKQVTLVSRNIVSKYSFTNARLTFTESSWSLDVEGEQEQSRGKQLKFPVRTFDLLECWPERYQYQLEFVMRQLAPSDWESKNLEYSDSVVRLKREATAPFDETAIVFLSRQIGFARSQINQIELTAARSHDPNELQRHLIRAKLGHPFAYTYQTRQVGWIETYRPLLLKQQVKMVSQRTLTMKLHHECALNLATHTGGQLQFHMVFCPNFGCGLLQVKLFELKEANGSLYHTILDARDFKLDIHYDLCEIHLVNKVTSMGWTSPERRVENAGAILNRAALSLDLVNETSGSSPVASYLAQMSRVSISGSSSLQSPGHDEIVVDSVCYTLATKVVKTDQPHEPPHTKIHISQLLFDSHHSRIHCRRACSMLAACETYSYNRADRKCVLTNLHQDRLRDPAVYLDGLEVPDTSGAIYSLDKLALFKRTLSTKAMRPADLFELDSSVVLWADLDQCASLSYSSHHLTADSRATLPQLARFAYMRLTQLCIIVGVNRTEFANQFGQKNRIFDNVEQLRKFIGKERASEEETYVSYERNVMQFFERKFGLRVTLEGEVESDGQSITEYGSSVEKCLQYCLMVYRDCVMLDYCSGDSVSDYLATCRLHTVRSPFSLNELGTRYSPAYSRTVVPKLDPAREAVVPKLSKLERDVYMALNTTSQVVLRAKDSCDHYYMTGDNLALKRVQVVEASAGQGEPPTSQGEPPTSQDEPATNLDEPATSQRSDVNELKVERADTANSWLVAMVQLLLGLAIGLGIFIVQPALVNLVASRRQRRRADEYAANLRGSWPESQQRTEEIRRALRWTDGPCQQVEMSELAGGAG